MIREQRIELDGIRTRSLELDPEAPSGDPPLLLFHGFSDSADCWRPLLGAMARSGRRVVAYDMPGFGQAARLDREQPILPQLDSFAAAAVGVEAERSPTGDVVCCGNSLGGCVTLRAAQDGGRAIAGIVPVAPAGLTMARWLSVIEGEALLRWLLRTPVPMPEIVVREVVGRLYRSLAFAHPGDVDSAAVSSFTRHLASKRDVVRILGTGHRVIDELRDPYDLERIECPVLLIWGDQDRMVYSAGAERVLREVPGSRIEVIERCGHCPQVETPERLAELLGAFPAAVARAA